MGYEFKQMPMSNELYLPVKLDQPIHDEYPKNITREDKLRYLWNEVGTISKKMTDL